MTANIKDVARLAGVSVSTVSRALGKGPVSAEVRRQVEAAVKATGYRPNLSARRLRSQRSQTIGLIVADIRNPFFTAVSRAVEDAAYGAGMRVILCNTGEDPEREALYLRLMQEERVTGLIFAPTRATIGGLRAQNFDYPVVLIDRAAASGEFDTVVLDNRGASARLVDHLAERGYRRIGGLFGSTSTTGLEREAGYVAAMSARGLAPQARMITPLAQSAEDAAVAWLGEAERPDAIIVSNGLFLLGLCRAARRLGLSIPRDLAIAGFDNEAWTELVEPGLTVIEQPVETFGREAMALLFQRLKTPTAPTRTILLAGTLIERGSTHARP